MWHFSCSVDNEKLILSFLTEYDMLGANMFVDRLTSNATDRVYPCQPNLDEHQTILCLLMLRRMSIKLSQNFSPYASHQYNV